MYRVDDLVSNQREVRPNVWRVARPENSKYESFRSRVVDAWYVLTRKADAVLFDEPEVN